MPVEEHRYERDGDVLEGFLAPEGGPWHWDPVSGSQDPTLPLRGFGIGGYRSLRAIQHFGPLKKVNVVAGRNNAGKSNVLRFLHELTAGNLGGLTWNDIPNPEGPPLRLARAFSRPSEEDVDRLIQHVDDIPPWKGALLDALGHETFHPTGDDLVWLVYEPSRNARDERAGWTLSQEFLREAFEHIGPVGQASVRNACVAIHGQGRQDAGGLQRILDNFFDPKFPGVEIIGSFRQVKDYADGVDGTGGAARRLKDYDGTDLVHELAELQHASAEHYPASRAKFDAIVEFARTVLSDRSIAITVSAARDEIQVHQHGRVTTLPDLGTGIEQVVILATAATLLENTLVCIEEPELHLHPVLQRKLVRYLNENTTNQYVLTSHSAHMLDYEYAGILRLQLHPQDGTVAALATTSAHVADICHDLGYRPSDLIQANCVIWVEGPSDRIYLRHWLGMISSEGADEFVEGIHYSVMFYGGSLLKHLTGEDSTVEDFISLRRLARHSVILIDSDREHAPNNDDDGLNAAKIRVRHEFDHAPKGFAWITAGYTIENYVPPDVLSDAVGSVHNDTATFEYAHTQAADQWSRPLAMTVTRRATNSPETFNRADKVAIARHACTHWGDAGWELDTRDQMMRVVEFITHANATV